MPHPAYLPDLAPTDFHMFYAPGQLSEGKKNSNREEEENALLNLIFLHKEQNCFQMGTEGLCSMNIN